MRIGSSSGASTLEVHLLPRSSKCEIAGVREGALALRVTAPPVEGKANEAARKLLADLLDMPRSAVRLTAGQKSRRKIFRLEGLPPDELRRRLSTVVSQRPQRRKGEKNLDRRSPEE